MCQTCRKPEPEFDEKRFWYNVNKHLRTQWRSVVSRFRDGRSYFNGDLVLPYILPIRGSGNPDETWERSWR